MPFQGNSLLLGTSLFSGFSSPIASMAEVLQWLTHLNLRYFLVIIRETFPKGVGMDEVWPQMAGLRLRKLLD